MFKIRNNNISLTRGDTADIDIILNEFELSEGDILTFTVKKDTKSSEVLLQKIISDTHIKIDPEDTSKLDYGSYKYDLQLTTVSGDIYTIITPSTFTLTEEVTW